MNEQASILFNISFSFSGESAGKVKLSPHSAYLQQLLCAASARRLYAQEGFEALGRQLAVIARRAYFARQMDAVEQASQLMLALPISKELYSVAQYYQAIYAWKQGEADAAHRLFNSATNMASGQYEAQGLLTVGATYFGQGEFEAALPYYIAAARAAREHDLLVFAASQKMATVVQSIHGDHRQALNNLEQLFPVIRAIAKHYPCVYYEFLNSYAVELGQVGRSTEAQNVSSLVLASPYVATNPEFLETRDELVARRTAATPSIIAVPAALETVSSPQAQAEPEPEPARARSTISLILRRAYSLTRRLTPTKARSTGVAVSIDTVLDRLAYSTLPRSPPALL